MAKASARHILVDSESFCSKLIDKINNGEDFAALADPATYISVPEEAWQRIKGRQKLKGVQLAVLQALAAWREGTK